MSVTDFAIAEEELALSGGPEQQRTGRHSGCLQAGICLLLVELCGKFTFFEVVCNMIPFCTVKLGYCNHQAAILNLCFVGASVLSPVLVGWLADGYLGRNKLLHISFLLHFLGTALLSMLAFPLEDFYGSTYPMVNHVPVEERTGLFHTALLTLCLGTGGIRVALCPLDAHSLQEYVSKKPRSSFNWASWSTNLNTAVVFLGIACIQHSGAGAVVVLLPSLSVFMALVALYMRHCNLIHQPEKLAGNCCAALSVVIAGFLEIHRKLTWEPSPSGKGLSVSSLACGSLVPQYVLLGVSEALINPAGALLVELVYLISKGLVSKPLDFSQVIDTIVELDRPENRALCEIPTDLTAS
ncbi:Solute carrier family 15 member 5 [Lemmus lemmus]